MISARPSITLERGTRRDKEDGGMCGQILVAKAFQHRVEFRPTSLMQGHKKPGVSQCNDKAGPRNKLFSSCPPCGPLKCQCLSRAFSYLEYSEVVSGG